MTKNPGSSRWMKARREADINTPCIEMHCTNGSREHNYGDPYCDFTMRNGSVVPKSAFKRTNPAPRKEA
jgi:hypothetical protein